MSDLFKRNRPKLTEREERALWERVREMPREAGGRRAPEARRPWWAGVWAIPAVRFGAPVLAVALVAVVWVVQQRPAAPVREMARAKAEAPGGAAGTAAAPESARELAPTVATESQLAEPVAPAPTVVRDVAPPPAPAPQAKVAGETADRTERARSLEMESEPAAKDEAVSRKEAAAPAPAARAFALAPQATNQAPAPADEARIAAIRSGEHLSPMLEEVVRPDSGAPLRLLVSHADTNDRALLLRDASGRWRLSVDAADTAGPLSPPGLVHSRAGLAVDLDMGIWARNPEFISRVRAEAVRLLEEHPGDPGTSALIAWCDAALQVFGAR